MNNSTKSEPQRALLTKVRLLQTNSRTLGVPEEQVATIVEWSEPSPLPFAPKSVLGIVCIEGRMMTVIDLGSLLDASAPSPRSNLRHIVALRGDEQLALAVETIKDTIEVPKKDFAKAGQVRFLREAVTPDGVRVQLVDINQLFPAVIQGRERRQRQV